MADPLTTLPTSASPDLSGILSAPDIRGALGQTQAQQVQQRKIAETAVSEAKEIGTKAAAREETISDALARLTTEDMTMLSKRPPSPRETGLMEMWGSPAMVLAMLGSAFTRTPLTNALNAGAAVQKAYREGDVEASRQAYAEWRDANNTFLKVHEIQANALEKALTNIREGSAAQQREKLAEAQVLMHSFGDTPMAQALQMGDIDIAQAAVRDKNLAAAQIKPLVELAGKYQDAWERFQKAKASNDQESMAKATADMNDAQAQARGLENFRTKGSMGETAEQRAFRVGFEKADKDYTDNPSQETWELRNQAWNNYLASMPGAIGGGGVYNPGNIRVPGSTGTSPAAFQSFPSAEVGVKAVSDLVDKYQTQGLNTISKIVSKYAPPSENPTPRLITEMASRTGIGADDPIDPNDRVAHDKIVAAILVQEQGRKAAGLPPPSATSAAGGPAPPPTMGKTDVDRHAMDILRKQASDRKIPVEQLLNDPAARLSARNEAAEQLGSSRSPGVAIREQEKADTIVATLDEGDKILGLIDRGLTVGIGGMIMRPTESIENMLKLTDETTRRDVESGISLLKMEAGRLLTNRSIVTGREAGEMDKIVRGMHAGDTLQNTASSIRSLQDFILRKNQTLMKKYGYDINAPQPEHPSPPPEAETPAVTPPNEPWLAAPLVPGP